MKKSISAPNLTKLSHNSSIPPTYKQSVMKKSVSTQALPEWFANATEGIIHEIQAEAVLKIPMVQIAACNDNKTFPYDILSAQSPTTPNIDTAVCLVTPCEPADQLIMERKQNPLISTNNSFIDEERYVNLLKSVRRGNRKRSSLSI